MSDRHQHDDAGEMPPELTALHRRLTADSERWLRTLPSSEGVADYAHTMPQRMMATDDADIISPRQAIFPEMKGHVSMQTRNTDPILPSRVWPRKIVAGIMATVVVLFAIVLVNFAAHRGNISGPGSGSRTPQPIPPTPSPTSCIPPTPNPQSTIPPTPSPTCNPSTPAPGAHTPITGIATSKSSNPGCVPLDISQRFLTDDPFCIFIWLDGSSKVGDEIEFRWFLNGQDITSHDHLEQNAKTIDQLHQQTTFFGMTYIDTGDGKVEVSYNGTLAFTATFSVAPNPNLPTPTNQCIVPTPSPGNPFPKCTPTPPPTPKPAG